MNCAAQPFRWHQQEELEMNPKRSKSRHGRKMPMVHPGRPAGGVGYYVEGGVFYDAPNAPDEAKLTTGLEFREKDRHRDDLRAVFPPRGSVRGLHDAAAKAVRLSLHASVAIRRVHVWYTVITDGVRVSCSTHVGVAPERHQAPAHPHAG